VRSVKTTLLILLSFSLTAFAGLERTTTLQIPIEGEVFEETAKARLSYLAACENLAKELQSSALASELSSVICGAPAAIERPSTVKFTGSLNLVTRRPILAELQSLDSDFAESRELAQAIHQSLCKSWKESLNSSAKKNLLFESCGNSKLDLFYVKPRVSSVGFRFVKLRTNHRVNEFCHCRQRKTIETVETPWGPEERRKTVFDLMILVDEGYFEKTETFEVREFCEDAMNKIPACTVD